jgi:hypothetical protein
MSSESFAFNNLASPPLAVTPKFISDSNSNANPPPNLSGLPPIKCDIEPVVAFM